VSKSVLSEKPKRDLSIPEITLDSSSKDVKEGALFIT
jgi:hypothetical protein